MFPNWGWDGRASYFLEPKERWIKDFIYWKTFGDPKNKFLRANEHCANQEEMSRKMHSVPNKFGDFTILECKVDYSYIIGNHQQTNDMDQDRDIGRNWKMDSRFEHVDKPLILSIFDKAKAKDIRVIGHASSSPDRKGKVNISLNW